MIHDTRKLIFFGGSEFSIPTFESLIKMPDFNIVAAITSPDKPRGRKKKLSAPPLRLSAQKNGIPAYQPETLKNNPVFFDKFKKMKPTVCVVASYGKIIPKEYLEVPKYGFLNIHPSLLPKYRGATPIQTAILNGEEKTGVTIMAVDEDMDHGHILASREFSILNFKFSNSKQLEKKLAELGSDLLIKTLPKYLGGKIKPEPQNHSLATYTRKFTAEDGMLNWNKTAKEVLSRIRALNPEPGTYTFWNDKKIKIIEAELYKFQPYHGHSKEYIGVVHKEDGNIFIPCSTGHVELLKIQLEGGKPLPVKNFINGHPDFIGSELS